MKEQIIEVCSSQWESKDSDDSKNDDIEHDEAQSPWKTGVYQSPIEDKESSETEPRTPKSQLWRFKKVKKQNLR